MTKIISTAILLLLVVTNTYSQTYSEIGEIYPLSEIQGECCVSGFTSFESNNSDDDLFAKSLIWAIESISSKKHEGINDINYDSNSFAIEVALTSSKGSEVNNKYYCDITFHVTAGKLIYHANNITTELSGAIIKKIIPFESLTPQKKEIHQVCITDFENTISQMLNGMFDYLTAYPLMPITHWNDIRINRVVKEMNYDECLLTLGKPQTKMESPNDVQWMYSTSQYVFFKNGLVTNIIQ